MDEERLVQSLERPSLWRWMLEKSQKWRQRVMSDTVKSEGKFRE